MYLLSRDQSCSNRCIFEAGVRVADRELIYRCREALCLHRRTGKGKRSMDTKTAVKIMQIQDFLKRYYQPERLAQSCEACPSFGKVWSCPAGVPDTERFFAPFSKIVLIGVQVYYDEAQLAAAADGNADAVRAQSYEPAKRSLLEALFQLERRFKGAVAIAAGRCEQCQTCTRVQGKPCCKPARMRYSFSAFQMDLMGIAEQQLGMPLIWSKEALPPYQVAIGALLMQSFRSPHDVMFL